MGTGMECSRLLLWTDSMFHPFSEPRAAVVREKWQNISELQVWEKKKCGLALTWRADG